MDRFDDAYLVDKQLVERKIECINLNPLQRKWSLVTRPEDYKHSSAAYCELGKQKSCIAADYSNYFKYFTLSGRKT